MAGRTNFFIDSGPTNIQQLNCTAAETIAVGDPVILSSGRVAIATTTSDTLLGVAMSAVTAASEDDPIRVNVDPDTVYTCTTSGTLAQTQIGVGVDLDGATGAFQVDENSTTYGVLKIIDAPADVGANVVVRCKFVRMAFGEVSQQIVTADIADDAVTADKIASAVAGNGLTGGSGTALSVSPDVTTGATVCALAVAANGAGVTVDNTTLGHTANVIEIKDAGVGVTQVAAAVAGNGLTGGAGSALSVSPDVTTGAAVCAATVGANGAGVTVDTTTIEHNTNTLRIAAQGNGIAGGAGSTLSVSPDVTTGATVCALAVAANGAGVTVDTTTIEHNTNTLRIAASAAGDGLQGGGAAALAVDVSDFAGTGLEDDTAENLRIAAAAAGNGLAGGAGAALSVAPDTTTGVTVCGLTVGANGAGTTVDNSTIGHTAHSLNVVDGGITAAKLNADSLIATKIPDFALGATGYGIPFMCGQTYTSNGTVYIFNTTAPFKFRILLWWNQSLDATASNVTLNNEANPVTTNLVKGAIDHLVVMATSIDNAYENVASGGSLSVVTDGAGAEGTAIVLAVPVA